VEEISLHVLDIVENAIGALATFIRIEIDEQEADDTLTVQVTDNGRGMPAELAEKADDPFVTTRTTRSVGLGLPLFKQGAAATGGTFEVHSEMGAGTRVRAVYRRSHIDRPPLGDMAGTVLALIAVNPDIDFEYAHRYGDRSFTLNTREVREKLGDDVPLSAPMVQAWLRDYLHEGEAELYGGVGK
jgi:hypothetical protein